jgi:hypothetical protein
MRGQVVYRGRGDTLVVRVRIPSRCLMMRGLPSSAPMRLSLSLADPPPQVTMWLPLSDVPSEVSSDRVVGALPDEPVHAFTCRGQSVTSPSWR